MLDGLHRPALLLDERDADGSSLQHFTIISAVANSYRTFRTKLMNEIQLGIRQCLPGEDGNVDRQPRQVLPGEAKGIRRDDMNLQQWSQSSQHLPHTGQQMPVQRKSSVIIQNKMPERKCSKVRDINVNHGV